MRTNGLCTQSTSHDFHYSRDFASEQTIVAHSIVLNDALNMGQGRIRTACRTGPRLGICQSERGIGHFPEKATSLEEVAKVESDHPALM